MSQAEIPKMVSVCGGNSAAIPVGLAETSSACGNILLGVSEPALSQRLIAEIGRFASGAPVFVVSSLAQLRGLAVKSGPSVIFLDSELLGGRALSVSLQELATTAPVVVLAPADRQGEVLRLVAIGKVEFIGRVGDFVPLAAALIERRLGGPRAPLPAPNALPSPIPAQMGELFRHEINNPLTGILGNAELVLAHREHLSPMEVRRLQTVVDLAVRLRENIRRISNAWEPRIASTTSA